MGQSTLHLRTANMYTKTIVIALVSVCACAQAGRVRRDEQYGAPEAPAYSAPEESYGAPEVSYSAPAYSAPAETGLDLTTLIIPLLALVGLFLLFPTYVTLTSVRRKRETGEDAGEVNMLARMQDMYQVTYNSFHHISALISLTICKKQ